MASSSGSCNWTDAEVFKLISSWGEDTTQAELEGCKRNKVIFLKIAQELKESGCDKSAEQCREKIKKLKAEYRKVKDKHGKTGTGRKKWKFLDALDEVLGHKPATRPPVLIDTLQEKTPADHIPDGNDEGDDDRSLGESKEAAEEKTEDAPTHSSSSIEDRKKRKRARKEDTMVAAISTLVDKMTKAQSDTDKVFLELEEKRMKMEENMREMEERQRREEREFQLKMMSVLMGAHNSTGPTPHMMQPFTSFHHQQYQQSYHGNFDRFSDYSEDDLGHEHEY